VPLLVSAAAVAAPSARARATGDQHKVFLGFDAAGDASGSTGTLPVATAVTTAGGGAIGSADGIDGDAADFPAWDGSSSPYKRVAVIVRSNDPSDPLSPGVRDFSFGASFSLDAKTQGGNDNGNNLLQRGLYGDPSQYKLQIDEGRVSCRIEGSRGAPYVKSRTTVDRNTWYAATCSRVDGVMTLTVQPVGGQPESESVHSTAGSVDLGSPSVPLSVGAKVGASGTVVAGNADQFNGLVDDVFVDIAD
jgi:hypothetical protein